jgi:hypothetical protein
MSFRTTPPEVMAPVPFIGVDPGPIHGYRAAAELSVRR